MALIGRRAAVAIFGNIAAPTREAIAVRRPTSAIAEESTMSFWRRLRSSRLGRPPGVASAPATSGTGTGGSIGAVFDGELGTWRLYPGRPAGRSEATGGYFRRAGAKRPGDISGGQEPSTGGCFRSREAVYQRFAERRGRIVRGHPVGDL